MGMYVVTVKSAPPSLHLVDARNAHEACEAIAEHFLDVRKATHDDIISLTKAGIEVIYAAMPKIDPNPRGPLPRPGPMVPLPIENDKASE